MPQWRYRVGSAEELALVWASYGIGVLPLGQPAGGTAMAG